MEEVKRKLKTLILGSEMNYYVELIFHIQIFLPFTVYLLRL